MLAGLCDEADRLHAHVRRVRGSISLYQQKVGVQDRFPCEVKGFNICVVTLKQPNNRPW
jgi:hypothetical protein